MTWVYTFRGRLSLTVVMRTTGSSTSSVSSGEVPVPADVSTPFEDFFEEERVRLFRALFAMTRSRDEAEDVSQEAFVRLWERWDRVSAMDDPAGYLHRTAMNIYRDRRRRIVLGMRRAIRLSPAPDDYEAVEARSVAAGALGELTPRQRAAVVLTEGLGYSAEETGTILGIKGSTVRALLFQARSALKDSVEDR
jgi:RNA polymerase sigma-70 factor (ECF subfamily)